MWQSTGGGAAVLVLFPAIQKIDDLNIDCFLVFLTVHKVEIFGGLTVIGQELSLRIQEENVEGGQTGHWTGQCVSHAFRLRPHKKL